MADPQELPTQPPLPTHIEGGEAFLQDKEGRVVAVPQELAARYVYEQGMAPVTADEVELERQRAKKSGVIGGTVAAVEGLALGTADVGYNIATAGARVPAALGYAATGNEDLAEFLEQTSFERVLRGSSYLTGGLEAENQFLQDQRAQQAEWPTLSALTRGVGQVGGTALSLGGGALPQMVAKAAPGVAARLGAAGTAAAVGAVEGASWGLLAPFEQPDNTTASREAVLASGLLGAVLGGVGGAAVPLAQKGGARLREVFGKPATETAEGALGVVDNLEARVVDDIQKAGPNPVAMHEEALRAGAKADAELIERAGKLTPETWENIATMPDVAKYVHRDVALEGATGALRKDFDSVAKGVREVTQELREAPLKRELVAKNLAADFGDDATKQTAAIAAAQKKAAELAESFVEIAPPPVAPGRGAANQVGRAPSRTIQSIGHTVAELDSTLAKVDNAADAYIAMDTARRQLLKLVPGLKNQTTSTAAHLAREGQDLLEFVEGQYRGLADSLFDESVWGRQGAAQRAVNMGWVDDINESRYALRNLASETSKDIYGRPQFSADPEKIRSYLGGLGNSSLRDENFRRWIASSENLTDQIQKAYALSPAQAKRAAHVAASVKTLRGTLDKAENIIAGANREAARLDAARAVGLGRAGNMVTGFAQDGIRGALSGLIFPGGRAGAVDLMKALREVADSTPGRTAEAVANAVETAMGAGAPKSKAAAAKAAASVRASGMVPPGADTRLDAARRAMGLVADASRAGARGLPPKLGGPLFESTRDLTRSEQKERYEQRRDILAQVITNPARAQQATEKALGPIMRTNPALGASLMLDTAAKLQKLFEALPGRRVPNPIPSKARDVVSDEELRTAEAFFEATTDPLSVFRDFQQGQLDYKKAKFAREQYPELFNSARAALLDILPKLEDDVPDNALAQLDLLLGMNGELDPTQEAGFLSRQAQIGIRMQQELAASQPTPNSSAASQRIAKAHETRVQKLMET
jgi:hypothetical protein